MKKLLITGATGNVGRALIGALLERKAFAQILAGVRNPRAELPWSSSDVKPVAFDFMQLAICREALKAIDVLFLLRPPQIADVEAVFQPLITAAVQEEIAHVVFLSVQGAEQNSVIPHHKIERLIQDSGLPYTFLRPAYFMQNFTTTLRRDLVEKDEIFLPAGRAKFTLIDVADIGQVGAEVMLQSVAHENEAYDLTTPEPLSFGEMAEQLSEALGRKITYRSPNLIAFFWRKRKAGVPTMMILVMIMLHYLPRFQSTPPTTDWVEKITGQEPCSFRAFAEAHREELRPDSVTD
ncbi:MAG TPA: NmrA family NAD(P)-binding protein [Saprospiraceae bacterium]|nr:NmrA family NAD(P)-binding protein [Saprospiraceae bacterium]